MHAQGVGSTGVFVVQKSTCSLAQSAERRRRILAAESECECEMLIRLPCIVRRQIQHMIKYRYVPFTVGKKSYKGGAN